MRSSTLFTSLLAVSPAWAAISPGSLATISTAVDNTNAAAWWDPLDESGGYDWLAYLRNPPGGSTANNNVMVVRRDMSTGSISRDCLKTSDGACVEYTDDAGHNDPTIALDGDGFVHVFTSMHNNNWRYYRSTSPYSSTTIVNSKADMPDQDVLITYPVLKRDAGGNLWLMVRGEASGDHTARGGYLYKYTTSTKKWARVDRFAYSKGYSVYPDDIQFSSDGDVHLQWEWSKYSASAVRHEGSYLRYTPSSGTYRVASGAAATVPVTQKTPDLVYQPLTAGEKYDNDINASPGPALQSAKMALYENPAGTVHIQHAYRFETKTGGPWQVRRATRTFGTSDAWVREIVYDGVDTTAGLGVTHDGKTVRIYYCRAGASAYVLEKTGSSAWTNTALAPVAGKEVERLSALMRDDGTDVLYLGAPTNVNATTGSLYLLTVGGRS